MSLEDILQYFFYSLDKQEVTDSRFRDQFADEDDHFPDQAFVSGNESRKQPTFRHGFNVGRHLEQNTVLDSHLSEEQQRKTMSGGARYRAMQVCMRINFCATHCTIPYCTVPCLTVLCCTVLCCAALCCVALYSVLCCAVLHCNVLCCTILYCAGTLK